MASEKTIMHRQVALLTGAQALFQTVSVLVMTIGALAGSILAPSPEWATAPIAACSSALPSALCRHRHG